MIRFALCLCLGVSATSAEADDVTQDGLTITDAVARATAASAMAGAGYLTVTNSGVEADMLLAVEAGYPRVELHTMEMEDGMARMRQVEGIEIPAGEAVTLEPGGLHVMFMGLNGDPFEVGEEIPATLIFEKAGPVEIVFSVKDMATDHGSDH